MSTDPDDIFIPFFIGISLLLFMLHLIFSAPSKPKPQWVTDRDRAAATSDTFIFTSAGKYSYTYFTSASSIKFNATNTCITFFNLESNTDTTTCGTFTIKGH